MQHVHYFVTLVIGCLLWLPGSPHAAGLEGQQLSSPPPVRLVPTSLYRNTGSRITLGGGQVLMNRPAMTCSAYDAGTCYDLGWMYRPRSPSFGMSFMYLYSSDAQLTFGLDTGHRAEKLRISPAVWLGGAARLWLDAARRRALAVAGQYRFGSRVRHLPCLDDFDRAYFCGALISWSDFRYDSTPRLYSIFITYQHAF